MPMNANQLPHSNPPGAAAPPVKTAAPASGSSVAQGPNGAALPAVKGGSAAAASAAGPAPEPPAQAPRRNPLAHLPTAFQPVDSVIRGFDLEASVEPGQVASVASQLDEEGFSLDTITGVDWLAQGQMEVVYDYFHPLKGLRVAVRSRVPRDNPEIPTISNIFPGANWHERETHDFFGIRFLGHPDLTPFLLPEDADYHPLKKDFNA
jgi:NADH:ubiquinone oxidoreductase subunit C